MRRKLLARNGVCFALMTWNGACFVVLTPFRGYSGCAHQIADAEARAADHAGAKRSQFKNNYFTEVCSGSEAGSYVRRIDFCMTQL